MGYMWYKYILDTKDQVLNYMCVLSTYDEKTFEKYNYVCEYDKYTYADLTLIDLLSETKTHSLWKISNHVLARYSGYEKQLLEDELNSILNILNKKYPEGYYVEPNKN